MFVSLKDWKDFWKSKDAADVTWATDAKGELVRQFRAYRVGTTIIIDRDGHIAYRYDGATSYEVLQAEVEVLIRGFPQSYRASLAFASPMSSRGGQEVPGMSR